jgi:tetratricopeptide (TPR) repeat protein
MKSTLFVRPNLKMFLLGAVLLVAVQHLITIGLSQGDRSSRLQLVDAREMSEKDLRELIRQATESPSVENYLRVSRCFERRGEYRKALQYLRRAEKLGQSEESLD